MRTPILPSTSASKGASRPKLTWASNEQGESAATLGLHTTSSSEVLFGTAVEQYLKSKDGHVSHSHLQRIGQRARSFGKYIGAKKLHEITAQDAKTWVESRVINEGELISKSTWNKLVTDLSTIFVNFQGKKLCTTNPFAGIKRFAHKSIGAN